MSNPSAFFREAGSGSTVVCIHSSASSSSQWRVLMETLSDRFRVVATDRYGHGKSPTWPGGREFQLDDEIALMAPILETAGQFHLIGHSYGGLVALKLALNNPSRVASLTLYEPACFFLLTANNSESSASREIQAVRDETIRLVEAGDYESAAQYFVDYWAGSGAWSKTREASRQAIISSMGKARFEWPPVFDKSFPVAQISTLAMPVLLLTGSHSTAAARGVHRVLRGLLPGAEVVEFSGLGHMGPVTHPEQVNETIATFLMRVEEASPVLVL
jgi:pimeloyl-ACP methyl ester carboxylesterase